MFQKLLMKVDRIKANSAPHDVHVYCPIYPVLSHFILPLIAPFFLELETPSKAITIVNGFDMREFSPS